MIVAEIILKVTNEVIKKKSYKIMILPTGSYPGEDWKLIDFTIGVEILYPAEALFTGAQQGVEGVPGVWLSAHHAVGHLFVGIAASIAQA